MAAQRKAAEDKEATVEKEAKTEELRELVMFEFMKELFAFGYAAADRMEERAADFARMRRERMDEFRRDREEMQSKLKDKFEGSTGEIRGRVRKDMEAVMKEAGVATQTEVEELKAMIADLTEKLDKAQGAKTEKAK